MKTASLSIFGPPQQTMPVAMLFTKQQLLAQTSVAGVKPGSYEAVLEPLMTRSSQMTSLLKSIEGYSHEGLNE